MKKRWSAERRAKQMATLIAKKNVPAKIHNIPHIHYEWDGYYSSYRVWCSWDPGDVFAMVPYITFYNALNFVRHPGLTRVFVEGLPEEDDGTVSCSLCKHNAA